MLDFLGEAGSLRWVYGGWAYLLSSDYRIETHARWRHSPGLFRFADILFSLAFMGLELALLLGLAITAFR